MSLLSNPYVEFLIPRTSECDCILFGGLKEVIKINEVMRMGPNEV